MKYVPTDMHAISNNKLLSCKHAVAVIAIPRRHAGGNEQYLAFGGRGGMPVNQRHPAGVQGTAREYIPCW